MTLPSKVPVCLECLRLSGNASESEIAAIPESVTRPCLVHKHLGDTPLDRVRSALARHYSSGKIRRRYSKARRSRYSKGRQCRHGQPAATCFRCSYENEWI